MENDKCCAEQAIHPPHAKTGFVRALTNFVRRTMQEFSSIEQRIEAHKSKF